MQSRNNARKAAQGGGATTPLGSDTARDTYIMFRHTLKMLEIASLLLRPDSSLWLLRMRINSQHQFSAGGVERSARGVFGDMLRIACSAFPSYRCVSRPGDGMETAGKGEAERGNRTLASFVRPCDQIRSTLFRTVTMHSGQPFSESWFFA